MIPPPFTVLTGGKFNCFTRWDLGGKELGTLELCEIIVNVSVPAPVLSSGPLPGLDTTALVGHEVGRADVWWYCGGRILRAKLPKNWKGTCALMMPFTLVTLKYVKEKSETGNRVKRELVKGSFDAHIYIDEIGVPRGVPDEFKARNQIAAGFESVIFWWSTINKNVDWINYIL